MIMTRGKKKLTGKTAANNNNNNNNPAHAHSRTVSHSRPSPPDIDCGIGQRFESDFPTHKAVAAVIQMEEREKVCRNSLNWDDFFGSSLDLAPSLLNIYDDKAASGVDSSSDVNGLLKRHEDEYEDDEDDTAPFPLHTASPTSAQQRSKPSSNSRVPSTPSSSSLVSTSSNIVFRSGKLPSLSQPLDRPVSLMETDSASISKRSMDPVDSKKRPLSLGSMSSVSTSSLTRARKKRASDNPRFGHCHASRIGAETSKDHHSLPSELVSESYSSMDSGCVGSDRNGERYYDDMSVTSSSEGASVRGDTATAFNVGGGTSSSSLGIDASPSVAALDRSDSSLSSSSKVFNSSANSSPAISKKVSGISEQFNNSLSPDVIYPPSALTDPATNLIKPDSSFDEDSYFIRKMGSYINRNSTALPTDFSGAFTGDSNDRVSDISTPEQERKRSASSRNEARERFYSNYEEHYSKYVSSPVDSESSFETLSDLAIDQSKKAAAAESTSPSTPSSTTPPFPINTQGSQDYHPDASPAVESSEISVGGGSEEVGAEKSPSSPRSPSTKYFDTRGGSSQGAPSSLHKSAASRSSRRRESSQEPGPSPTTPVYVSYVQRVVMEIVDSERTYLTSLEDIIYGYLEPLEHMLNMDAAKDDIMCLFSNIRDIYIFNRCFLADLEKTDSDPIKVAECFVKHNMGFVIYTEYCTNYPSAVEVLTRFMKHPELSELCRQRQLALGHGLPLGAYLLRPVQRILKYHLLLQNIVKNYEKEKRDVPVLKQAFQHMTQMAHHINEMKRKHEHAVRIQEIQSQLEDYVGEDLTRLGDLVLESTFQVYGAKASRQVFLFERGLLISKKKEGGMLSCKTFIKCSNLMLVEVIPNEPLSFHAIPFDNPRAQYTFQARNMEQKRRWCQEIKRLILESFKGRIPDSVKNLVMELGRDHDDDFVSKEAQEAVRKHQHTAPEYLEKRRVRRKSGSRMPDFSLLRPQKAKRNVQRKNEKPADIRRTESKSPDLQRKAISKLVFPQHMSETSSLPTTPVSELNHQNLLKQSSDPCSSPASASPLIAQNSNSSLLSLDAPKITSSVSSSDISESSLQNVEDKEKKSLDVELVRRASSFRTAIRANPVVSVDLSDHFPVKGNEKDKSVPKVKKGKRRFEWKKLSKSDMIDNNHSRSEKISEDEGSSDDIDHDEYVLIDENIPASLGERNHSGELLNECHKQNGLRERDKGNQGKMPSRSSSLPALVHAVSGSGDAGQTTSTKHLQTQKDFQSSENVCRNSKVKGRMSRKDVQDATKPSVSGRYIKKKHASKYDDSEKDYVGLIPQSEEVLVRNDINKEETKHIPAFHDTFARHAAEKNAILKAGLPTSNTYSDFGSQDLRSHGYSKGVKAKLTNWNSVDKLTKGSMNDLSHLHENPWELNSKTSRATSLLSFDNGAPSTRLERSGTLPSGSSHEKNNLDWLVYLKRNSLLSSSGSNAASNSRSNRKSTSVLDQGFHGKEILDLKRRTSAQSPYATPPRYFMTTENMKRFGSSKFPDKTVHHDDQLKQLHRKSPLASSEMSIPSADPMLSRQDSCHHPVNASISKRPNPVPTHRTGKTCSLDADKLTHESNKMVAEMEDYISRTSSCESVKSPNKFPTVLPTISLEEKENEATSNNVNRFSVVSSVSTSSYESQASSSSEGLTGTLKSKLQTWASQMGKRSETYENIYQSPVLSDDEDDDRETVESSASPPKSKNTFVPPHPQRKTLEHQRGLETVLREHSLGSASLGSRMANSVPIPISPKLEDTTVTPLVDNDQVMCKKGVTNGDSDPKMSVIQTVKFNENLSPEQSRYSLPATKEAVEALMPPALGDCDIQQSDSGFSIHSNSSNVSDSTSPINLPPQSPHEMMEAASTEVPSSSQTKPVTGHLIKMKQDGNLQRQNSYESIDSTDSFYERRLSLALSTDGFEQGMSIVPVYDDTVPQGQVDVPQRKSIKEYVQQIEQRCKPMAPQVCEVRRRTPGFVIQQKLQSLKENAIHGRNKKGGSKDGSEEREFVRAKSQPPSQHRSRVNLHTNTTHSIDDLNINTKYTIQPKLSPSRSKENLYLPRSKELSRSRDYINLSPSKENLTNIDGKLSLPRASMRNAFHARAPGHERDWNSYQLEANEDCSDIDIKGQFVHKVKQESSPLLSKKTRLLSSSEEDEGVLADRPEHREDQLSSEVDNLVIMKGWVKALITKFQNK